MESKVSIEGVIWLFVNIVLPIVAPMFGMFLERQFAAGIRDQTVRDTELKRRRQIMLFKDGQLGWVGLVMCFAAMSDFVDGVKKSGFPAWGIGVIFSILVLVLASGFFATRGAVETNEPLDAFSWKTLHQDYSAAFWTIIFTSLSGALFGFVHFWSQ